MNDQRDILFYGVLVAGLLAILCIALAPQATAVEDNDFIEFDDGILKYKGAGSTAAVDGMVSPHKDIIIPNTVTHDGVTYTVHEIYDRAFLNETGLETVRVMKDCEIFAIYNDAFYGCTGLKYIQLEGMEKLDYIDEYAFSGCTSLTEISLPESLGRIMKCAFEDCSSLKKINFADDGNLDLIDDFAFVRTGFEEIVFSESVGFIGYSAFANCQNLKWIAFEEGSCLRGMGLCAFANCYKLTDVYFPKQLTEYEKSASIVFSFGAFIKDMEETYITNSYGGEVKKFCHATAEDIQGSRYHRESGSVLFVKAFDVTYEGYGTDVAYAGTTLERPSVPERRGMVLTGWFEGDRIWKFDEDVVDHDVTLTPKWAIVQEGYTVVEADKDVDISTSKGLDYVTVVFSNGKTVSLDITGHDGSLRVSSYDLGGGKFELTTQWSDGTKFAGNILVSVPIDEEAGIPTVYLYEGKNKTAMETTVIEGVSYFLTDHNSTFGVEYSEAPAGNNAGVLGYVIVIVALVALVLFVFAVASWKKH